MGLTEHGGYDVAIGVQEFSGVAEARGVGETRGSVEFVADATRDHILGCHMVGPDAGNLVHEAVVAGPRTAVWAERSTSIRPSRGE